ncbi:ExeA family protein [Nitrosococcus oceani]|uniref:ExeA family protein n=1 Tax=Nitrosococcus oceani TaxID=1229 RepID=UPI0004E8E967|nr:AAA family ATPase [Nitrosococcus oceani]KFI22754.1 ATPase AAA [Nitrosococcus oceani]
MYTDYFGLKSHPFRLVPDPHYFFPAPFHQAVSKCLLEGLIGSLRIAVVSGPPGVGKTLLLTRFMEQLGKNYPVIFIHNPKLGFEEFLALIQSKFNITAKDEAESVTARFSTLDSFGKHISQTGKRAVILVDEADNISQEAVQVFSELTRYAAAETPSFFIVLASQSNTANYQRLLVEHKNTSKVYSLLPLLADQVGPYVDFRLRQAGYIGENPFSPEAITSLVRLSHGIPQLINQLCGAALLEASLTDKKLISSEIVDEVARSLWLALGNNDFSDNLSLAKGTETAFLPITEQSQTSLESAFQTNPRERKNDDSTKETSPIIFSPSSDSPALEKQSISEKPFSLDKPLSPEQQTPQPTNTDHNYKTPVPLPEKRQTGEKKPWIIMALGVFLALIVGLIGGAYLSALIPGKASLPAITEPTEDTKNTANKAEGKSENSFGKGKMIASDAPPLTTTEKNRNPATQETTFDSDNRMTSSLKPIPEKSYDEISPKPGTETTVVLAQKESQQDRNRATISRTEPKRYSQRSSQEQQVTLLLAQAKQQEAAFKLTTPESDNAYESYTAILEIAPNHPEAAKGLQRIRDYYIRWGLKAEDQRDLDLAAIYYKRALNVFPNDFAVNTALRRVEEQLQKQKEIDQPTTENDR